MIAALLVSAVLAQAAPPPAKPATPPSGAERLAADAALGPLAPEAQRQLDVFRARLDAARTRHGAEGPATSLAVELRRRVELDQLARKNLSALGVDHHRLPDFSRADLRLSLEMAAIDADNTAWLKSVLPPDGWFRRSRNGEEVVRNAWMLLIHTQDDAFMDRTLARMEPLVRSGEVDAGSFASRFDRVAVLAGRPQRYGTAAHCVDGYKNHYPIEDRPKVDERRKALGLKPLAAAAKDLDIGNWCGGAAAVKRP